MKTSTNVMLKAMTLLVLFASQPALAQVACSNDAAAYSIVEQKKGQGNGDCSIYKGPGGAPMYPLAVDAPVGGLTTSWVALPGAENGPFADVAVVAAADGSTCIITYTKDIASDGNMTTANGKPVKEIQVCTDGMARAEPPPPPEPKPIVTGEDCEVVAEQLQTAIEGLPQVDVVFGVGLVAPDSNATQLSLCSDRTPTDNGPVSHQRQCVDRCETPTGYPDMVGPEGSECGDPLPDGRLPIGCRRCATSGYPDYNRPSGPNIPDDGETVVPWCWELMTNVAETTGPLDPDADPALTYPPTWSYRPIERMDESTFSAKRVSGSLCYLLTGRTSSGYPYSAWVSLDGGTCPCDTSVDSSCVTIR